jgi:hypothetical protein
MNSTELREKVGRFSEKAKQAQGQPSLDDIDTGRKLYNLRKEFLSDEIGSNVQVKFKDEPDWNSWPSLAEFFSAYYSAMVELNKKVLASMNAGRLDGI